MTFKEQLKEKVKGIEEIIQEALPKEEGYQKTIFEAMNYSVLAGGKRLRPMLMQETYELFGGTNKSVLHPFMAAIEMIHTYSLIHDDLPALDNDEYRRGRKTTHVVYGEAMAILAGDALLNEAYETASKAFDAASDMAEYRCVGKAIQILASKPGIYGMIGGQVVDVECAGEAVDHQMLDFIHEMKTSALIECAMMIGAALAGAASEALLEVEQIAKNVGIAFQIQDDILDVTSTTEVLGKPVHSDEKNEKTTYVTLIGMEASKAEVIRRSGIATTKLSGLSEKLQRKQPFLEELIINLIYREK